MEPAFARLASGPRASACGSGSRARHPRSWAASEAVDAVGLVTVEEKVGEALECLSKVDDLKTVAARIGKDAEKVGLQASSAATTIRRLLTEAQTSLSAAVATDSGAGAA